MKRLYNSQNFVRYRINFFNDFLTLYTLYRSHSNWKFFLKKKSLLNINSLCSVAQMSIRKKKLLNGFLLNNFFIFRVRFSTILKNNEYNILINYLKMIYLVQSVLFTNMNIFVIGLNSFVDLDQIFTFLTYLQTKVFSKESVIEVSNVAFRLFPVSLIFRFIFFHKYGHSFSLLKNIVFNNFFQIAHSFVLVEVIFIRLVLFIYYLIIFQFMLFFSCLSRKTWLH